MEELLEKVIALTCSMPPATFTDRELIEWYKSYRQQIELVLVEVTRTSCSYSDRIDALLNRAAERIAAANENFLDKNGRFY